ncbi:MAG: PAS domain S-box protein [Spirochaetales bacterium]|nr:PAS domain S-box protein [Spirochaetales bacterium]
MKRILSIIGLLCLTLFSLMGQSNNHVLFISSYHPGFLTLFQQIDGLQDEFKTKGIEMDIEFMDMKRFPDEQNEQRFYQDIKYKIDRVPKYDAIVVGDDYAFNFALKYQNVLFSEIPIVFLGVNDVSKAIEQNKNPWITGVIEAISLTETIDLMLLQRPDLEQIIAISDNTVCGRADAETFLKIESPDVKLKLLSLSELSWNALLTKLRGLNRDTSSLLLLSAYTDINNETKSFDQGMNLIKSNSSLPIYHLWEHGIGFGILGGHVVSHFRQGQLAGNIVGRIFEGENIQSIPVVERSPNIYSFDFNELKAFGIGLKTVPSDSILINSPAVLSHEYRILILNFMVVFGFMSIIFVILLLNYLKIKKIESTSRNLKTAIEQIPISVVITNKKGDIEYVNNNVCELTGYCLEELIGQNPRIFKDDNIHSIDFKLFWSEITGGHDWRGYFYNVKKDGSPYIEKALVSPMVNEKGVITNFIGIQEDVTDQIERDKINNMLLFTLDQTSDSVEILGLDKKILYVNREFTERTGYSSEEVLGRYALDLFGDATTNNAELEHVMWYELERGRPWRGRYTNKIKDGSFIIEDVTASPVHDNEGQLQYYSYVKKNMTTILEQEKEQQIFKEKLNQSQKLESIGRLAGGVAHDFNNVLGVIIGYTEISMEEVDPEGHIHNYLEQILKAAIKSADITQQLLAFARKQDISPQSLNINTVVEDILDMLKRLIGENIQLSWVHGVHIPPIFFDHSQFDQVVVNLCINAKDAIDKTGEIEIGTDRAFIDEDYAKIYKGAKVGEYVRLTIKDNGCGMAPEILEHVFEPFFTTKEKHKGTGLGLATVYGCIKQNNGFITVSSEIGVGSTFELYFPLASTVAKLSESKENLQIYDHDNDETILLVEDELENLEITKNILIKIGYRIMAVDSPVKALNLIKDKNHSIDLLVSDVIMPEMSGFDLYKNVLEYSSSLPCLFISGYTDDVFTSENRDILRTNFLQKPFTMSELAAGVRKALDGSDKTRIL